MFCDRKNLIYDSLGTPGEGRLDFLPLPEVIQRGFPINKGRFSGMEERMANDGMTMEICILRAKLFPEKADECSGVRFQTRAPAQLVFSSFPEGDQSFRKKDSIRSNGIFSKLS